MGKYKDMDKRRRYLREYQREYRKKHPDRIAMYSYNAAIRRLAEQGIDVPVSDEGGSDPRGGEGNE